MLHCSCDSDVVVVCFICVGDVVVFVCRYLCCGRRFVAVLLVRCFDCCWFVFVFSFSCLFGVVGVFFLRCCWFVCFRCSLCWCCCFVVGLILLRLRFVVVDALLLLRCCVVALVVVRGVVARVIVVVVK